MTLPAALAFFTLMLLLAALPSASVALVVGRTAAFGFWSGAAAAAGIVAGDLIFMFLALSGISVLADHLGPLFIIVRALAGIFLIWQGIGLLRSQCCPDATDHPEQKWGNSHFASFGAGIALTLGDLKAILFYASLFPALIDPARLHAADILILAVVTILAVGGVKLLYAHATLGLARQLLSGRLRQGIRQGSGALMAGTGLYLLLKH